jgi:hypothetical protein
MGLGETSSSTRAQRARVSPACIVQKDTLAGGFPFVCPIHIHLPAPLGSTGITPLRRYYGRSDSCPALLAGQVSPIHVHGLCDHSVSNHLVYPRRRFCTLPLSAAGLPLPRVQASPFVCWLAGHTRPNRVRHPTDWSFTSCCFPPRLAATQLQSVTGRRAHT